MKDFFTQYPNAKSYFKVGDQVFLNHCKSDAEIFARTNGLGVEEIFPTEETEATETNQENADEDSAKQKNIKSTVKKSGSKK